MSIIQTLIGTYSVSELTSITFVGSDENSATSGNTASATIPATAQAGDIGIFSFAFDRGNLSLTSGPSGWTEAGNNFSGTEYPEGASYVKVLTSGDVGNTVSATVNSAAYDWTAFVSVYRPNVEAVSVSAKSFVSEDGRFALGPLTITSSNDSGSAMIVYGWAAGRPVSQNPTETMSPAPDAYITGGSSNGDIAYKLYSKTDTAVNHTWSTTDSGRQVAHAFYVVPSN